jgi:hypothetical protein
MQPIVADSRRWLRSPWRGHKSPAMIAGVVVTFMVCGLAITYS